MKKTCAELHWQTKLIEIAPAFGQTLVSQPSHRCRLHCTVFPSGHSEVGLSCFLGLALAALWVPTVDRIWCSSQLLPCWLILYLLVYMCLPQPLWGWIHSRDLCGSLGLFTSLYVHNRKSTVYLTQHDDLKTTQAHNPSVSIPLRPNQFTHKQSLLPSATCIPQNHTFSTLQPQQLIICRTTQGTTSQFTPHSAVPALK